MSVDYDELWRQTWGGMQDIGPVHRHVARIIVETVSSPLLNQKYENNFIPS